jgi:hypothetical protein
MGPVSTPTEPRPTRRRLVVLGCGVLIAVALVLALAPRDSGDPFFAADFERGAGLEAFDVQRDEDDRIRLVDEPDAFSGDRSARFEVRPGDEAAGGNRAELAGPSFSEGDVVWFRQAIRVDADSAVAGGWQEVVQYSANGDGPPALALLTEPGGNGDRFRFKLGDGDGGDVYWRSPELERDTWHDVGVRVLFSSDQDGEVSVHLEGSEQTLENGERTMAGSTFEFGRAYFKTGIYRSDSHDETSIVYHDRIRMGRSAGDVGL